MHSKMLLRPVSTALLLSDLPFCPKPQVASMQNHRTAAEQRAPTIALIYLIVSPSPLPAASGPPAAGELGWLWYSEQNFKENSVYPCRKGNPERIPSPCPICTLPPHLCCLLDWKTFYY